MDDAVPHESEDVCGLQYRPKIQEQSKRSTDDAENEQRIRRSTPLGPRHLSKLRSVRTWYVFLSAWSLAVPREFDSEYEIRAE